MKVVYNACYGGFNLSEKAIARYWEIKGETMPEFWSKYDIARNDPVLVQVVEELGDDADEWCSSLAICDVPTGQRWRIDEYDGLERVMTIDDYRWQIAT